MINCAFVKEILNLVHIDEDTRSGYLADIIPSGFVANIVTKFNLILKYTILHSSFPPFLYFFQIFWSLYQENIGTLLLFSWF